MKLTTQDDFAEFEIKETLGIVNGNTVRTRGFGHDFMAGLKNMVGGEINSYVEMLEKAREMAIERMVKKAESIGADGIVCVRLTTSSVMQGASEIMAFGTAVRFKK